MGSGQKLLYLLSACGLVIFVHGLACTSLQKVEGGTASYQGLPPDEFMIRWLVLGPIPVSEEPYPDADVQERAFHTDFLADQGGEAGVHPAPGLAHRIGDREYVWQLLSRLLFSEPFPIQSDLRIPLPIRDNYPDHPSGHSGKSIILMFAPLLRCLSPFEKIPF